MNLSGLIDVSKRRVVPAMRERGVFSVLRESFTWIGGYAAGRLKLTEASTGSFEFDGATRRYVHSTYNHTWMDERSVEIALAREVFEAHRGEKVLEVGNVTRHYFPGDHTVVDKYEVAPGVLNVDVVDSDFAPGTFDLIVAISTLEHVGFDEDVKDPDKPARAVAHLKTLLRPGGTLWVTHPVNYNPALDAGIRSGEIAFDELRALIREERRNVWRQVEVDQVWQAPYEWFIYAAHGLVVASWTRPVE